jgi:hypothetical protein
MLDEHSEWLERGYYSMPDDPPPKTMVSSYYY